MELTSSGLLTPRLACGGEANLCSVKSLSLGVFVRAAEPHVLTQNLRAPPTESVICDTDLGAAQKVPGNSKMKSG